jgi:hypothetical protein
LRSIFITRFYAELEKSADPGDTKIRDQAANKALGTAQIIFRRLLLRGIDYLPPGELSFADVGRAITAADRAVYPDSRTLRDELAQRFVDRKVVPDVTDLESDRPHSLELAPERLAELRDSDWAAYQYVEQHRDVLEISRSLPFTVLPRVDSTKATGVESDGQRAMHRELILKVSWNRDDGPSTRPVPTGATVSLSWQDGSCLALVRGGRSLKSEVNHHG